ncbi:MAG: isoprenylcysteine carboxylmethyltransferase family protein [Phycisphaerae bacterium]|nr:isoprenylcysteine carboxylmethyltransferase family protein [Phycisphaerae bacterium]
MSPLPAYIVGCVVLGYWGCVVVKIFRAARKGKSVARVFVPRQSLEQGLWTLWIPTILCWIALPFVIPNQHTERRFWLAMIDLSAAPLLAELLRWLAAILAVVILSLSIYCWRYMGRSWRLGVDTSQKVLLTEGPFRWSRHPIYSLGLALMVCTVVAVPAPAMFAVAVAHFTLIHLKVRVEERFLLALHGDLYENYRRRTGRFVPRFRMVQRLEPARDP